jgi:hypothetical protein
MKHMARRDLKQILEIRRKRLDEVALRAGVNEKASLCQKVFGLFYPRKLLRLLLPDLP